MIFYTTDTSFLNFVSENARKDLNIAKIGVMYFIDSEEVELLAKEFVKNQEEEEKRLKNIQEKIDFAYSRVLQ